ncbi:hypothetical protein Hanom_Chr05g00463811 [Helianthus anomalus]
MIGVYGDVGLRLRTLREREGGFPSLIDFRGLEFLFACDYLSAAMAICGLMTSLYVSTLLFFPSTTLGLLFGRVYVLLLVSGVYLETASLSLGMEVKLLVFCKLQKVNLLMVGECTKLLVLNCYIYKFCMILKLPISHRDSLYLKYHSLTDMISDFFTALTA